MLNPILSIIIPIFNCEMYVKLCIESIINQSLDEYEIIIINDCSTDKSWEICKKFSYKDNFIYIEHEGNRGPGIARNSGLSRAKGQYVFFMDGDDVLEKGALLSIYKHIKDKEYDYIFLNHKIISEKDVLINARPATNYYGNDIDEFLNKSINNVIRYPAWKFIIKRNLITHFDLNFSKSYIEEDVLFTWKLLALGSSISFINDEIYAYRIGMDNSLTGRVAIKPQKAMENLVHVVMDGAEFYQNKLTNNEARKKFKIYFKTFILRYLQTVICVKEIKLPELDQKKRSCFIQAVNSLSDNKNDFCSLVAKFGILEGVDIFRNRILSTAEAAEHIKKSIYVMPYDIKQFPLINMLKEKGIERVGIIDNNYDNKNKSQEKVCTLDEALEQIQNKEIFIIVSHIKDSVMLSIEKQLLNKDLKELENYIIVR